MFINDIDGAVDIMDSIMSKFADDTKWGRVVEDEEDQKIFQEGLDKLMKWSQDWQMDFNVDKCHIMHIGNNNKEFKSGLYPGFFSKDGYHFFPKT